MNIAYGRKIKNRKTKIKKKTEKITKNICVFFYNIYWDIGALWCLINIIALQCQSASDQPQ